MRRNELWAEFAAGSITTVAGNLINANPAVSPAIIATAVGNLADAMLLEHDKRMSVANAASNFVQMFNKTANNI